MSNERYDRDALPCTRHIASSPNPTVLHIVEVEPTHGGHI